jgi:hypothetical protein
MRRVLALVGLAGVVAAAGCGGERRDVIPVSGTVTLDGRPLGGATVTYRPTGDTPGNGGTAVAGPDGRYAVSGPQGQRGLPPGAYRVSVSLRLRKDGTAPPPDVPPIESDASETLPAWYSDPERTELSVAVDAERPYDLPLKGVKR